MAVSSSNSPSSLHEFSISAIISNLGELAGSVECLFSCGGTIPQVENVVLFYKKRSGDWCSKPLELPAGLADDENVQAFLDSCSTASLVKLSLIRSIVMLSS